jgi:hypothetical protein
MTPIRFLPHRNLYHCERSPGNPAGVAGTSSSIKTLDCPLHKFNLE